jgi:hypothetical protein
MRTINCKDCKEQMAELLLDDGYAAAHPDAAAHVSACAECSNELKELRATMSAMDAWVAPEISPYFDSKLRARVREAASAAPEGFWERMRSYFLFSTGRHLKPALAGALGVVLLAGGGTVAGIYQHQAMMAQASPTVNDLKIMDNNAQALQQMDQLLDDSDDAGGQPQS